MKRGMALLLAACLMLALAACTAAEPFDAGTPLTPGEVAALQEQLQNGQTADDGAQDNSDETSDIPQNGIVFWIDSGQVYHSSETCYHIKEKPNLRQGTVAEAEAAGKSRICAACAAD